MTRIFEVDFKYEYYLNGRKQDLLRDKVNVVATDVVNAISKLPKFLKPSSFIDEETGKKMREEKRNPKVMNVNLIAESD